MMPSEGPSDAFRTFVHEALRLRLATAHRNGQTVSPMLRAELERFAAWVTVGTWADLSGQQRPSVGGAVSAADSGGVTPPGGSGLAVSLAEAARLLGVSERTVRRLAASGDLGTVTVGRRRLVPMAAIRTFLQPQKPEEASA